MVVQPWGVIVVLGVIVVVETGQLGALIEKRPSSTAKTLVEKRRAATAKR
jgi:hypothetical protein